VPVKSSGRVLQLDGTLEPEMTTFTEVLDFPQFL
jgi:hypothetical protein